MSNDTRTIDLVINNLTEEQFENVFSPDPNELWLTPDDTPAQLAQKVDKTSDPNKIYGTDAQGNQTTYPTPTIPTVGNGTITITQGGKTKGRFTTNQSGNTTIALDAGGSGGAVDSVNGKTGVVVLTATDVGALPDSTVIPDAQIQSDWNQADNTKVDFIKNKPTIPVVNNATLKIQKNGTDIATFTANSSTNTTANISVPTKTSDISNDSGFITNSVSDLANYTLSTLLSAVATSGNYSDLSGTPNLAAVATSGSYNDLNNKPTIPVVNNPTITITQGGVSKGSFTLNQATGDTIALDAGGSGSYHPDLFDVKWADHICNDVQWLRADTFSWQSGAVYQAAYQHLADDIDGKTLQSETIAGTTIQFYLADDGHKICPATEESNVSAIYNATGVAWYYIIDIVNTRFKLPRTQFGVTGFRDVVGNYVPESLPNITGGANWYYKQDNATMNGAFAFISQTSTSGLQGSGGATRGYSFDFDASRSSSAYQNFAPVQQRATQMYLYFYVGEFTQTALENTAGLNAELFNNKVDKGHQVVEFQEPTAENNYTWYRKYADGWVEQGGLCPSSSSGAGTITLPIEMADNNYQLLGNVKSAASNKLTYTLQARTLTTTTAGYYKSYNGGAATGEVFWWQVSGMAA